MPFKIRHSTLMMIYLIKLIGSHQVRIISCSLALNNLPFEASLPRFCMLISDCEHSGKKQTGQCFNSAKLFSASSIYHFKTKHPNISGESLVWKCFSFVTVIVSGIISPGLAAHQQVALSELLCVIVSPNKSHIEKYSCNVLNVCMFLNPPELHLGVHEFVS